MAKMDGKTIAIIVLVIGAAWYFMNNMPATTVTVTPPTQGTSGSVDLCTVVEPSVGFTGQRLYLVGTALTTDNVTVLKMNGGTNIKNLGKVSLNSGSLSVEAKADYKLLCGFGSAAYYPKVEAYQGKCKASKDEYLCTMCAVDTAPTITVLDKNGAVQNSNNPNLAIAASDDYSATIKVKAASQKCYGMPQAPKGNALCFDYNTTLYTAIDAPSNTAISAPYVISSAKSAGAGERCYEFGKLASGEEVSIPIVIKSTSSNPTGVKGNITVKINDIMFDINQDTFAEIYDFQDEDNNVISLAGVDSATIGVS